MNKNNLKHGTGHDANEKAMCLKGFYNKTRQHNKEKFQSTDQQQIKKEGYVCPNPFQCVP